jgi:hypothetical protein
MWFNASGIMICTTLIVIDMISTEGSHSLLFGRPWLREAKTQHDWFLKKINNKTWGQ